MNNSNKTIMIIEDDPLVTDIYKIRAIQEGFDVIVAANGAQAMKMLKVEGARPDLILLDILMPLMDGWSILKEIKASKELKNVPVIVFTNLEKENEVQKGAELGAEEYLIKAQVKPSEVMEKIKKYLSR